MRWRAWLVTALLLPTPLLPAVLAGERPNARIGRKDPQIRWKKTVLDKAFRSEGVAVVDVNRDGKLDVVVGDVWYEAPQWKMHVLRKDLRNPKRDPSPYDPLNYSECFGCFADDFNGDGWPDVLVIPWPGKACYWYENPRGKPGPWKAHLVYDNACNETPQFADLFGTGRRVLIMGAQPVGKGDANEGELCWFAPGNDPTKPWEKHAISGPSRPGKVIPGTFRFSHGLGVGDVNGDNRLDVICTAGWWEQPAKDDGKPWKFHPADLGPDCADMFAYDLDGDGKADIVSSSAHNFGIWWHKQGPARDSNPTFVRRTLFDKLMSQTHALHCVDIDGDGLKDLVTGRRWWAHGPKGDVAADQPPYLYWFKARRGKDGLITFLPMRIDDDSGVGTQFAVADINGDGLPDIIISNKKGVFIFTQVRTKED